MDACLNSCGRGDSNPHALRHQILSLAWLPITTRPQFFGLRLLPAVLVSVNLPEQFADSHLELLVAALNGFLGLVAH